MSREPVGTGHESIQVGARRNGIWGGITAFYSSPISNRMVPQFQAKTKSKYIKPHCTDTITREPDSSGRFLCSSGKRQDVSHSREVPRGGGRGVSRDGGSGGESIGTM